jgi:hypothetical protein
MITIMLGDLGNHISILLSPPRAGNCTTFVYTCKAAPVQINYGDRGQQSAHNASWPWTDRREIQHMAYGAADQGGPTVF